MTRCDGGRGYPGYVGGAKRWKVLGKRQIWPSTAEASPRRAGENLREFERRPRSSWARARARTCFHSFDLLSILRVDLEDRRTRSLGSCHRSALAPRVSSIECAEGSRIVPQHVRRAEGLGGSAAGSAGISEEPVVRAVKLHHRLRVTDGYYPRVMESCARSGQGVREEASHFITAEKTTRGVERGEIYCTCVPDAAQSGEGDLRPPRPGRRRGHQRRRSSIRRVRTWHVVRAPRADPARKFWSIRTLAGGSCGAVCGAVWSSVDVSFRVFS